jgi:hypothetical protein
MAYTTDSLSPALAERLSKLMARSQSPFDAEALTALRMANKALAEAGLSWPDALTPEPPAPEPKRRQTHQSWHSGNWRDIAQFCLSESNLITSWEQDFCLSILNFRSLSPKQSNTLWGIYQRVLAP